MIQHFHSAGKEHTDSVFKLAFERATTLGISEVVVATTSGDTAYKAKAVFNGFSLTAVTYHCGFKKPFTSAMRQSVFDDLTGKGVRVVSCIHALSGVERAFAGKHGGTYPALIAADVLRLFGQGTKVAVEIALMAADAGALSGNDIISIGGSGKGADTALVIKPSHAAGFLDLKIREIICKPRDF